jgi:CubicO group peptidase (beta-lactamase class C family)
MALSESTVLKTHIEAQEAIISRICHVGGAPGHSLSVSHRGEEIYSHHFGHDDVVAGKPPDGETIYFIGSMTKAMVAALAGILVEDGNTRLQNPRLSHLARIHRRLRRSRVRNNSG